MNTKNTATPDSWANVETIVDASARLLAVHVGDFGVWWCVKNRPRPLPVELVDAMRATNGPIFLAGLPRPLGLMTHREIAEHTAEHIRRADPVVVRMLMAFSDGPGDAQVPESLELVFWTLKNATDAVGCVERAAAAHDAAIDELFNTGGHA